MWSDGLTLQEIKMIWRKQKEALLNILSESLFFYRYSLSTPPFIFRFMFPRHNYLYSSGSLHGIVKWDVVDVVLSKNTT